MIFSAPMVRALRDGSKTQTRHIVKPGKDRNIGCELSTNELAGEVNAGKYANCPYGQPGDRLWVRESWSTHACFDSESPSSLKELRSIHYWADGDKITGRKRPSIHMPRAFSRTTLEIVSIRVERLQDISEADARAEGCDGNCPIGSLRAYLAGKHSYHYAQVWESINGSGSWEKNPWVWVIEFKKVTVMA